MTASTKTPVLKKTPTLKKGKTQPLPTKEQDYRLTIDVVAKIAMAQKRRTLSPGIYIRRLPTQIVLENTTESDREWVYRNFPGGETKRRSGYSVKRDKRSRKTYEEYHHEVNLREDAGKHDFYLPRLEVWGIMLPHECRDFVGYLEDGKPPYWRCGAYGCRKRVPVTQARELGLLPPRTTKK